MSYLASSNGPERLTYIFTPRVYDDYLQCRAAVKVRIAIRLCNEDFVFCFKDFTLSLLDDDRLSGRLSRFPVTLLFSTHIIQLIIVHRQIL